MPGNGAPKFEIVERNLRRTMQFYSLANEQGEVRELPGVMVVSSGVDYGVFNSALLSLPLGTDGAEMERRITAPAVYFGSRGLHWSYWVCDDMVDFLTRRRWRSALVEVGLRPLTEAPGMYTDRLLPPTRPLPAIQCRRVGDAQTRFAFTHITSIAFHIPFATAAKIYNSERAWRGDFLGHVGYAGGMPVAVAATVVAADAVGVYSVGTLPDHRHKGYAEALLRRALDEIRERTGVERTVLQSTRSGHAMYEKMGYRSVTRFAVYLL